VARNRHMIHVELTWLLPLYSCLGFEAKRLIGEPCKRGADGEEFAPGRRGLTIHEGPGPRTMPEDIEDQPDAWPDDKVFPIAGQAEPKAPKSNSLSRPWKEVPLCFHRHWSSQRHCSRRAAQPPATASAFSITNLIPLPRLPLSGQMNFPSVKSPVKTNA